MKYPSSTLLGVRLEALASTAVLERLTAYLHTNTFHHIATVNPEFLVEATHNVQFKHLLNKTDLNVVDGFGLTFWGRVLHGYRLPRLTGVELAESLCELAEQQQKSVYFLGGFGVAQAAAEQMKAQFPTLLVAGTEDGHPEQLSDQLRTAQPDIILVAFGAPKQELWIDAFRAELPHTRIAVGVGGTFDFWAGKATRAPKLMQKLGLEWLWRLITEPRQRALRVWRAVGVFSWLVVKEKFKK